MEWKLPPLPPEGYQVGQILTWPGFEEVNPVTYQSTGRLQQFRVTAKTATGYDIQPVHEGREKAGRGKR
jgi:hypothetical protein